MKKPSRKVGSPVEKRLSARYRPTGRAWFHNLAWTTVILVSWPIAAMLTLIERLWTHE